MPTTYAEGLFLEPPCLTLLGVSLVLWKGERGNR
jgi:hypothetical protein